MKGLQFFSIFLCSSYLLLNTLSAQTISVYATIIDDKVQGSKLDAQTYQFIEDGVVNYTNGTWVAIKLKIPSELAKKDNFIHLSYALLDTVELWIYENDSPLKQTYQTGQSFKFDSRPYTHSDFVFPIREGTEDYYFRIYSSKPIVLPFQILLREQLINTLTIKDFLFGIYVGIILVMILYNLVLIFVTRDNSYAYYVLYLITLVLTQSALFGYTDRFLMPNWPIFGQKFAVLSGALVAITSVLFINNFLHLKRKAPLFAKLILSVIFLDSFGILYLMLDWDVLAFHWVNTVSLYGSILGIMVSIKLTRTGFKPAKFFLLAWTVFLMSVITFALSNIGIIPYKPYFQAAMLFGSSIEVIMLSVALADRINVLRREKEESKERALKMAKENERIIREQNVLLEETVQLRTKELQGMNKELKLTLSNLKAAQTQLVQSEKMASLGILTAGVAHEINNPLNYIHGGYIAIKDELENKKSDINKESLKKYLQWIKKGAEKATKIVKSLNIFSRTHDNLTEECNLNSIMEESLSILQNKIKGQIEIRKELDSDLSTVKGNSGKLHQVILNLLTNAIDSIKHKGIIKITTRTKNDSIIATIEDNGCGISQENLKKVLDPFFTTKPAGKGTGLGLSIAHSIIQEHRGNIHFDSEMDKSTIVTISLPKL